MFGETPTHVKLRTFEFHWRAGNTIVPEGLAVHSRVDKILSL